MSNATRTMATTLGVIFGLSGLEHGLFEAVQGNVAPQIHLVSGHPMIYAIGDASRFWAYGFEYAYTIVPNYLITGILAIVASLLVIIWSARFIHMKAGWIMLILLSTLQYLVGGGAAQYGPAVIVGLAAFLINYPLTIPTTFLPSRIRQMIGKPWAWLLTAFAFVFCHSAVTAVFGFFYGLTDPEAISQVLYGMLYLMMVLLPLTILSALAYDSRDKKILNLKAEQ